MILRKAINETQYPFPSIKELHWQPFLLLTAKEQNIALKISLSPAGRNAAGKGTNYAYQGVEPSNGLPEDDYIRHAYYQWVPFVLFLQGMIKDFIKIYFFFKGTPSNIETVAQNLRLG